MRLARFLSFATLALALTTNPAVSSAQEPAPQVGLRATYLNQPPTIDGVLDDDAWSAAPLKTGEWKSYNPLHGDTVPQQTTVWVGYDKDALYFAFRCDDPEPNRIKTSITRRDNIWSDDWVGLSLDALGTGQVSYHLLVNPSGIQLDMILPWLRPSVFFAYGQSLYYDAIEPFVGNSLVANVSALFQIGGRFSQDVEFSHNAFDRIDTGARVYTVNLLNTRTTYQFSKELAVRWIARYDSQRRRVLTDLLGSYDLRPGTVFYVGYGSLYQKRAFRDAQWFDGEGDYLTTNQGLFLKASYLFRF